MDAERHQRISDLFQRARRLDPTERAAFLRNLSGGDRALRGEVEALLAEAEAHPEFLEQSPISPDQSPTAVAGPDDERSDAIPDRIGPYRIIRRLGEGGLGVVYLAEQLTPIRRLVAVKLVKKGMDTRDVLLRFEREQQALALMNHPNIAQVHDAGRAADGQPFFVMEYVPGQPITEYCDRERLSMTQRLELFVTVCQAIQHAHQKGIIHRDIKPSNILVTQIDNRPTPKVIDFGIAKAMDRKLGEHSLFTAAGMVVGTIGYMSPEQADPEVQDIDTRADVYALGVLLYELLTGTTPFDTTNVRNAALEFMRRMICEEEPPRPSVRMSQLRERSASIARQRRIDVRTLNRQLRGDLDWVVMQALEKDRSRRYASASELAADVTRYLNGDPVDARRPTAGYRLRKFVKRHKALVGGVAATFAVLVAGVIGTSLALQRARLAERRTAAAYRNAPEFMSNLYRVAGFWPDPLSEEQLAGLIKRLMEIAGESNDSRAQMQAYELLGQVLLWRPRKSDEETDRDNVYARNAFAAGVKAARAGGLLVSNGGVALMNNWANTCAWTKQFNDAVRAYEELIATRRAYESIPRPIWARDLHNLSFSLENLGKLDEAIEIQRKAIELRRQIPEAGDPSLGFALKRLGSLCIQAGRWEDAEPVLREAIELVAPEQALDDGRWVDAAKCLAEASFRGGRYTEAEELFEAAWIRATAMEPPDPNMQVAVAESALEDFQASAGSGSDESFTAQAAMWRARLEQARARQ